MQCLHATGTTVACRLKGGVNHLKVFIMDVDGISRNIPCWWLMSLY